MSDIEKGFRDVPDSVRVAVYWYWLNNNISKEGVVKDLEAMKRVGITRAFIGNQATDNLPYGNVPLFSPEWLEITHQAMKTAGELDIEIGMFNCPGWSQSGGPWITPEESMKYVAWEAGVPDVPQDRIIAVLAWPKIGGASRNWTVNPASGNAVLRLDKPFTVRTISLQTTKPYSGNVSLRAGGEEIRSFYFDRHNFGLNVGFVPDSPMVISLPETAFPSYELYFDNPKAASISVSLSEIPAVEQYAEKSLAKMFQEPLPMWDFYMWNTPPEASAPQFYLSPDKVLNLTDKLNDGKLDWEAGDGEWEIYTAYMKTTGVTNSPAVKEGTGLEVDKINKKYIASHFDAFIGELIRKIPAEDRKTWKVVVEDSYETGSQNWTDDMRENFLETFGYDPIPYLPVLKGVVVGSADKSDRFLWDLRRLIADKVANDYVGGLREECNKHGMQTWLENYGHWGFPSEFMLYGSRSDQVSGEFWSEGDLGDIENKAASSCAHAYGKPLVWAESCTAAWNQFGRYPRLMKERTDHFFCEGINATLLHLFIQQPDDRKPGLDAWFGNEFNRNNSWFDGMGGFISYLRRCNFMLRQGRYVADVAYFIGEDAPKMTGVCDPALPQGYSYDYVNGEILREYSRVKDGRLVLDSGMEYSVLVLPRQETMRPEMLECIYNMVNEGLTIVGPAPTRSPSLQNYGPADEKVRELAGKIWNGSGRCGKGRVYPDGTELKKVLDELGIGKDFSYEGDAKLEFIHRNIGKDGEIYFVSNQEDKAVDLRLSFRAPASFKAERWNPVTGDVLGIDLTEKIHLDKLESVFIVFRKDAAPARKYASSTRVEPSAGWKVSFSESAGNPAFERSFDTLEDWALSEDPQVKYFSGKAEYSGSFTLEEKAPRTLLHLGNVMVLGSVKVNGKDAGHVWTYPYSLDITDLVKTGENSLEIKVYNNWKNRLIGDSQLPEDQRKTWTNIQPWEEGDELQSSGLLGPVSIELLK